MYWLGDIVIWIDKFTKERMSTSKIVKKKNVDLELPKIVKGIVLQLL